MKNRKNKGEQKEQVILSVQGASYRYEDAEPGEYAIRDVSYDFERGKIYAIRGRSGTGKTTLLSLITGLERCTEGRIVFDGRDLKEINLDYYRSHEIGIVFQSYNLLPYLTAGENIRLSLEASGKKVTDPKGTIVKLMEEVGLKPKYYQQRILKLSGGEQQRVAIARSLSYNPQMIIADEPTGNLDRETEDEILRIFERLAHQDGKCVVIVTHSKNVCNHADVVYELKKVH